MASPSANSGIVRMAQLGMADEPVALGITRAQGTGRSEMDAEPHVKEHGALRETITQKVSLNWDSLRAESERTQPPMQHERCHLG